MICFWGLEVFHCFLFSAPISPAAAHAANDMYEWEAEEENIEKEE